MKIIAPFILSMLVFTNLAWAQTATMPPSGLAVINGLDDTLANDDLRVLKPYLVGKEIIGLGETEHGTMSDQARFRFLKYLIEEEGVRTVIAEFPDFAFLQDNVQNYFESCAGDPVAVLQNAQGEFRTTEFLKIIKFVCEFNQAHPADHVRFLGGDPGRIDGNLKLNVLKKLETFATGFVPFNAQIADNCFGAKYPTRAEFLNSPEYKALITDKGFIDPLQNQKCLTALHTIRINLKPVSSLVNQTYGDRYSLIIHAALDSLYSSQQSFANANVDGGITAYAAREEYMGRNFFKFLDYVGPRGKTVLLMHNFHISKAFSQDDFSYPYVISVGERIKAQYGDRYFSIGMTGYDVRSFSRGPYAIPTSPKSLDLALSQLPSPFLIVDPRKDFVAQNSQWYIFGSNSNSRPNGWLLDVSKQFDLLFFMKSCPESHPIR